MKRYITELIGTFFLLFTISLTGNPMAIGVMLVALVYMGGYISGAHYNPAVTLAMVIRRKIEPKEAGFYMLSQILGAALAALVYFAVKGSTFVPQPSSDMFVAALVEIICTFALTYVILNVATSEETEGNHYYGIAIGFTLMAIAYAGGPISGGVYNPAVIIGTALIDIAHITTHFGALILYTVAPLIGGTLAAMAYNAVKSSPSYLEETPEYHEEIPLPEEPPKIESEE